MFNHQWKINRPDSKQKLALMTLSHYTLKFWEWIKSSSCVKTRPLTHRSLPASRQSFQLSSNPSGHSRKFTVHFSKLLLPNASVPSITSCFCQALRQWTQPSGLPLCARTRESFKWWCLWNTEDMRPPLICGHVAANISAGWWDQCFLSWRASVSSLSLVLGQCLFFFSSRRHNSPTTIPQQSNNNRTTITPVPHPLRRFFFFFFSL